MPPVPPLYCKRTVTFPFAFQDIAQGMLILFWILWVVFSGCAAALVMACTLRINNLALRILFLINSIAIGARKLIYYNEYFRNIEVNHRFVAGHYYPFLIAALAAIVVSIVVIAIGFTVKNDQFRAKTWPRRWLLLATVLSGLAPFIPFYIEDSFVRADLERWDSEANQQLQTLISAQVPEADNARLIYDTVTSQISIDPQLELLRKWNGEQAAFGPPDPREIAAPATQAYANQLAPFTEQLRKASRLPRHQLKHDFANIGREFWGPNALGALQAHRLLAFEARFKAHSGDPQGALSNVEALQRLALQVDQETHLLTELVALTVSRSATTELSYLLQFYPMTEQDLLRIQNFRSDSPQQRFYRLIEMHKQLETRSICSLYLACPPLIKEEPLASLYPLHNVAYQRVIAARRDLQLFWGDMEQLKPLATFPAAEMPIAGDSLEKHILTQPAGVMGSALRVTHTAKKWSSFLLDVESNVRLSKTGIAAYRYALKNGQLPESLEPLAELNPQLDIMDPYSGGPLKMIRNGNKLTLYSIGQDQIDDGGKPLFSEGKTIRGDQCFTIRDPNSFK